MSLNHHLILFVDDEESITKALRRLFRREHYEIHTASGGEEGLRILRESDLSFAMIVSDQQMPGMTGVEFLEATKHICPRAIRLLLTGYSDVSAIIDAINRGEVHRYMTKPWNDEELLLMVKQSLAEYDLVMENLRLVEELKEMNRTLEARVEQRSKEILLKNEALSRLNRDLEMNLYNAVKAFSSLVERQSPALAGHGRRVAQFSREIGKLIELPEQEVIQIEIAALLHDFGKLAFPHKLMDYREEIWNTEERRLYRKHPQLGQETVHFISKLDHVGLLIRSHHERFDGQGYPNQLSGEEIPIGARIIAVANAFDKIANMRIDLDKTVKGIRMAEGRLPDDELFPKAALMHLRKESFLSYDADIIKHFLAYLKATGTCREDRKIAVQAITSGMVLARPLYSSSGRFILPAQTTLTESFVRKIRSLHETDFIEALYVLKM